MRGSGRGVVSEPALRPSKASSEISPFSVCSVSAFALYSALITDEALTPGPSPSGRGENDVRAVGCEGSSVCSNALGLIGSFVAHSVAEPIHSRRLNSLFSRL